MATLSDPRYTPLGIYKRLLSLSACYWPVFIGVAISSGFFAASDAGFAFLIKQLTEIVAALAMIYPYDRRLKRLRQ